MENVKQKKNLKPIWIVLSFLVLIAIVLLPTPASLPVMGKMALAILAFAVIMWVTEAVSYPVSSTMIVALIITLIGFSPIEKLGPSMGNPMAAGKPLTEDALFGTQNALKIAFSGFSSSAVALVAAALFLATAMQVTNLHKRLALLVLSVVGNKTNAVVAGSIIVFHHSCIFRSFSNCTCRRCRTDTAWYGYSVWR